MSPSVTEKEMLSISELLLVFFEPVEENGYIDIEDFYNRTSGKDLKHNLDMNTGESHLIPVITESMNNSNNNSMPFS